MRLIACATLVLVTISSALWAEEALKRDKPMKTTKEETQRYFECRTIKATDLEDERAPTFQDYHVAWEPPVSHPRVDTKTTVIGRRYRTVLRNGIASGANYAGHYTVVVWGCGSSCTSFAVVNLKTGQVIIPNEIRSISGTHLGSMVDQFLAEGMQDSWGYRYRLDSRLLVLVGAVNEYENREGAYYYIIEKDRLKQVHETRVVKDCNR
jgi:hypothetical protein